jgi:ankyrin repeat protein
VQRPEVLICVESVTCAGYPCQTKQRNSTQFRRSSPELLIAKGADVNAKAESGETPLDWAIMNKQTELTDLLRKHGGKTGEELKAEGK